jgi:hypothetical protein
VSTSSSRGSSGTKLCPSLEELDEEAVVVAGTEVELGIILEAVSLLLGC